MVPAQELFGEANASCERLAPPVGARRADILLGQIVGEGVRVRVRGQLRVHGADYAEQMTVVSSVSTCQPDDVFERFRGPERNVG